MRPTKRTKLSRLLREILTDDAEDRAAIAAELRVWAFRLEANANGEALERPNEGGRPRAWNALEDDADPDFLPFAVDYLRKLVKAGRRFAQTKRNPATFREQLPPGKVLLGPLPSPDDEHAEAFRQRFADVVLDTWTRPKEAAARLTLWYGAADDSLEEAERLLERLKKRGKTPA